MLSGLLLVLDVIVCIALVFVVLLQRSEGGAFGMGGGPTGLITARGAGDLLTRTTWILFGLFLALSLGLTLLGAHDRATSAVVDRLRLQTANTNAIDQQAPPPTNAPISLTPAGTNSAAAPFLAPAPAAAPTVAPAPAAAPRTTAPAPAATPATRPATPPATHAATPATSHAATPTHAAPAPATTPAAPAASPPPPVLQAPPPAPAPSAPTPSSGSSTPPSTP